MKYFIDTEFHEYKRKPYWSRSVDTIELISIGIVTEDGREFYAVSKDFDIKAAWNNEWLRNNVLKNLFNNEKFYHYSEPYSLKQFERLINYFGKSNKQIAKEVKEHIYTTSEINNPDTIGNWEEVKHLFKVQLYGYYAYYDWVVFCWLFGRMIDLPKGFPMYCIDLKQILDEKANKFTRNDFFTAVDFKGENLPELTLKEKVEHFKMHVQYPTQTNEHNALADAKWNLELYKFLQNV